MSAASSTSRWLGLMLAVLCVGALHHRVCNNSPGGGDLLWWIGNGNTWLLSLLFFEKILGLTNDVTARLLWPAMGYIYYTVILLPIFGPPFQRDANAWAKATILPVFHLVVGATAFLMNHSLAG